MTKSISTEISLLDAGKLSTFRARLINKGKTLDENQIGQERQNFIELVLAPADEFVKWLGNHFRLADPQTITCTVPTAELLLAEGELASPPESTEKSLSETIQGVSPRQAALPAFWASCNLELLRRGVVREPSYFAKPIGSGSEVTGCGTLEQALKEGSKHLDSCIRTLCRQLLGGVPEERGQVSVFLDPRIARAWWRGHVVQQAAEDLGVDPDPIWKTLRLTGAPWEELVQHMVRKLTHVGERAIRSALVVRFVEMKLIEDSSPVRRKRTVDLLAATGQCAAGRSLGVLSPSEVLDVLREI